MDGLGRTNTRKITVALISKHQAVGPQPFDTRCYCGSPAMSGLLPVDVNIAVSENRTTYGRHADSLVFHAHVGDDLCHQLVYHTMATARQ